MEIWHRATVKWISPDEIFAFATSEMKYGGDLLLHAELCIGNGPTFEGRKPGDVVSYHTVMQIDGKQVPKEWRWE